MTEAIQGCVHKRCTACEIELPISEFYKKKERFEAKCKKCLKSLRAKSYWRKASRKKIARCKIAKVNVKEVLPENLEKHQREMEVVMSIFENLIFKVLSKKMAKGA